MKMILILICGIMFLMSCSSSGCIKRPEISPSFRLNEEATKDPMSYVSSEQNLLNALDEFMLRFNWKF